MKLIKTIFMILLMLLMVSSAFASEAAMPIMAPPPDMSFGQNHYYSVVFDEEGDAIIAARLDMTNIGKNNMKSVELEIPGRSMRIVNVVQEVRDIEKKCSRYVYEADVSFYEGAGSEKRCANWYERQVTRYYSVDKHIFPMSKSTRVILDLEREIEPQEKTTILIYYKVHGYVSTSLGLSKFDFETIKLNQDINQIRVAVNVQEGLYLKGGEANVDYIQGFGMMETAKADAVGMESPEMTQFSDSITYARGYVKNAQGLDPFESFHVEGEFAKSWFGLHSVGVLTSIAVFLVGLIAIVLVVKRIMRTARRSLKNKENKNDQFLAVSLTGIAAAILTMANWVITALVIGNLRHWIGYRYDDMIAILLFLLSAIMTLALLVAPPIFVGKKYGYRSAFAVVGITLVVLILLGIIVTVGFAVFTKPMILY